MELYAQNTSAKAYMTLVQGEKQTQASDMNTVSSPMNADVFCCAEDSDKISRESENLKLLDLPPMRNASRYVSGEKLTRRDEVKKDLFKMLGIDKNVKTIKEAFKDAKFIRPFGARRSEGYSRVKSSIKYGGKDIELVARYKRISLGYEKDSPNIDLVTLSLNGDQNYSGSLNLRFDTEGKLNLIIQSDDPFNGLGKVMKDLGYEELSLQLSTAPKEESNFFKALKRSHDNGTGSINKTYSSGLAPGGKKLQFVPVAVGKTADIKTPIGTNSLSPCTAFIVIDKVGKKHHMTHVNGVFGASLDNVNKAISEFNLKNSEFHLVLGASYREIPNQLFDHLTKNKKIDPSKITIHCPRPFKSIDGCEDVIILDGKLYRIGDAQYRYAPKKSYSEDKDRIIEEMSRQWGEHLKALRKKES